MSYSLKTLDKAGDSSIEFSDAITVIAPPPNILRTSISWKFLSNSGDSARVFDTIAVAAYYHNAGRQITALQWYVGRKDSLVKTVRDTANSGGDTARLWWADTSTKRIYVAVTDRSSAVWWDSTTVVIARDLPVVNAGNDTGVWVNDTVALRGVETQRFGAPTSMGMENRLGQLDTMRRSGYFFHRAANRTDRCLQPCGY